MKRSHWFILLAAFLSACPLAAAIEKIVVTESGQVKGVSGTDPSITVFKGIPFAAPPVGNLRWRPPQPPLPQQGMIDAGSFGASCIQSIVPERKPWTYEFMTHGKISEDCLFLNVWTPAKSPSERRPVFFYIYGGGFSEGSGAVPVYDGEGLARKGLVVVTANYRIGVLGFLAHPELSKESDSKVSGNYGLLDQIAALRWVQKNIAAFGGDPHRVTIAGQSAGGMSVHSLIASPLAKGLFHRAIVQSGGSSVGGGGIALGVRTLADAEADGLKFAALKGTNSLAELRDMSWQKLTETAPTMEAGKDGSFFIRFSPIVDGYLLPASVREIMARGKQNDVPVLTGVNAGELGGLMMPQGPVTVESFIGRTRQTYGSLADELLKLYPATTDREAAVVQTLSNRGQALVSLYLWAMERARTSRTRAVCVSVGSCFAGAGRRTIWSVSQFGNSICPEHLLRVRSAFHRDGQEDRRHDVVLLGEFCSERKSERETIAAMGSGWTQTGNNEIRRQDRPDPADRRRSKICVLQEVLNTTR
jgi:para-nitrobenzyl esterase